MTDNEKTNFMPDGYGTDKILQLLSPLKQTPAGGIVYQQIESILENATYAQNRVTRGYAALLQTLLTSIRKQLPHDSLLYLEIKLVQQRLYPPISLAELASLQTYIKRIAHLSKENEDFDHQPIQDALAPLLADVYASKSSSHISIDALEIAQVVEEPTSGPTQNNEAPTSVLDELTTDTQDNAEEEIHDNSASEDILLSNHIIDAMNNSDDSILVANESEPDTKDSSEKKTHNNITPLPTSLQQTNTESTSPLEDSELHIRREKIETLQNNLANKVNDTATQHKEFGSQLETVLQDLRKDDSVEDVKIIKESVLNEVHKLLASHGQMTNLLDETKGYIDLVETNSQKLNEELNQVRVLSLTDELTNMPNRRAFMQKLEDEIRRTERYGAPLTLVMLDLDFFKEINDKYGHAVGDQILRIYSDEVLSVFRRHDMVSRYGGEEFAVLLSNTDKDGALRALKKVHKKASQTYYPYNTASLKVPTFSAGVAIYKPGESMDALIVRADTVLYKAKQLGRNRVEIDNSYLGKPESDVNMAKWMELGEKAENDA